MSNTRFLLFDAANTLIHKPALWERMDDALKLHGITVDIPTLQKHHKLVSELLFFPDRTNAEFYKTFNSELLYSMGIIPTQQLTDAIFKACTYLDWAPFPDTAALSEISLPKGILSNFNNTLSGKISEMFPGVFSTVITSEELECAKPSVEFYSKAIKSIGVPPENIIYVGDSIKLDMEPAVKKGMTAYLIDRMDCFPNYPNRINSLTQLSNINN